MPPVLGVVSPHLDDAALSCGQCIGAHPGSQVVTVFAGGPAPMATLTVWDRLSGCFAEGDDVVAARKEEDRASSAALGAVSHHLSFWDRQYRSDAYGYDGPTGDELEGAVVEALWKVVAALEVDAWVLPLGICHADHELVGRAGLSLARGLGVPTYLCGELPYRLEDPPAVRAALARVADAGLAVRRADGLGRQASRLTKLRAVRCHRSQLRSLGRRRLLRAAVGPEKVVRLVAARR